MTRSVPSLEHDLRLDSHVGGPDLATIHRLGERRRRTRVALGAGAMAVVVVAALGASIGIGDIDRAVEPPPVASSSEAAATPRELSALGARVLADVPGARQVSPWQVVIPAPDVPEEMAMPVEDDRVLATVDLAGASYAGVTSYQRSAFPSWLHDTLAEAEKSRGTPDEGYGVGTTTDGVIVASGDAVLGCVRPFDEQDEQDGCLPALLTRDGDGALAYDYGLGTDDFLEPDADMEVFLSDDYSTGTAGRLLVAGLHGTEVARAEVELADGTTVPAQVESGTVVPGDTMLWAHLTGTPTAVVAYDTDGDEIESHPIKPCSGGVDCEVR